MIKVQKSLSRRIISVAAVLFFTIGFISYLILNSISKDTFYHLEKEKASIIAQNYAPFIAMHMFMDTRDELSTLLQQIMKNKNILQIKIYDKKFKPILYKKQDDSTGISINIALYQPNTINKIGRLELIYSTKAYNRLVDNYFILLSSTMVVGIIVFIWLNIYISRLLKPLTLLAELLRDYSTDRDIDIPYQHEKSEVGLIANAMSISHKKTLEYSKSLESLTEELIDKNINLENRVKEEVLKIKERDRQIIQQSKLAQMGEMISMIAHQWRQPLTAISATSNNLSLKFMLEESIDRDEFQHELGLIDNYSQHLSSTVDDFRNFFRPDRKKDLVFIEDIINDTLKIAKVSLKSKGITLIVNIDVNVKIKTYPNELKQVLLNLIKNAQDALLDSSVENPTITLLSRVDSDNVDMVVQDNAGGVPQDIMDKIFEPYFSTKLKKDGTGLGLYMSKVIIEGHCGGRLSVENDQQGAIFKISFSSNVVNLTLPNSRL
jgi:signal transduction histidine kinase